MYGTAREAYIDILTELVKEEAPTLYLEDFLYYFNKGISEYLKLRYEKFEMTQQLTDDLRPWKKRHVVNSLIVPVDSIGTNEESYRHLLNCIVKVILIRPNVRCDQKAGKENYKEYKATRMSSTIKASILNNDYLKPEFYRPYFDIIDNTIEVYIGDIDSKRVSADVVYIEYLKNPIQVNLTEAEVKADADTSQVLEFPTDIGEEITKVVLRLILERGSNPRLQSNVAVAQTVNDLSIGQGQGK